MSLTERQLLLINIRPEKSIYNCKYRKKTDVIDRDDDKKINNRYEIEIRQMKITINYISKKKCLFICER